MNNQLARTGGLIVTGEDTDPRSNPFMALPKDWRMPVMQFHGYFSDYFKGKVGLVTRVIDWQKEYGLTIVELEKIFRRVKSVEVSNGIQYIGQLQAALAEEVRIIVRDRRAKEETKRINQPKASAVDLAGGFLADDGAPVRFQDIRAEKKRQQEIGGPTDNESIVKIVKQRRMVRVEGINGESDWCRRGRLRGFERDSPT